MNQMNKLTMNKIAMDYCSIVPQCTKYTNNTSTPVSITYNYNNYSYNLSGLTSWTTIDDDYVYNNVDFTPFLNKDSVYSYLSSFMKDNILSYINENIYFILGMGDLRYEYLMDCILEVIHFVVCNVCNSGIYNKGSSIEDLFDGLIEKVNFEEYFDYIDLLERKEYESRQA